MGLPFFFFALGFSVQLLVCSCCLVNLYMVEGRGLAFDAKVRGWLSDGRKYATEFLFAYLAWNEKGNLKVFWVSHTLLNRERFYDGSFRLHTSIEMWKVLWWFSAFHFLVVWFLLSFVFLLLCWRIGGYVIFCGLRSVIFLREGGCAVFWCSRGGFLVVFAVLR